MKSEYDYVELMAQNRAAGKPVLQDAKIYRGSLNIDQNFTTQRTHSYGTLDPKIAYEFAEQAAGGTRPGKAFIGTYSIDRDKTRIFRDNGIEQAKMGNAESSKSIEDAERRLTPLVDQYRAAQTAADRSAVRRDIEGVIRRELYEVPIAVQDKNGEMTRPDSMRVVDVSAVRMSGVTPTTLQQYSRDVNAMPMDELKQIVTENTRSMVATAALQKGMVPPHEAAGMEAGRKEYVRSYIDAAQNVSELTRRQETARQMHSPDERSFMKEHGIDREKFGYKPASTQEIKEANAKLGIGHQQTHSSIATLGNDKANELRSQYSAVTKGMPEAAASFDAARHLQSSQEMGHSFERSYEMRSP